MMLLILGIITSVVAAGLFFVIAFAEGMSSRPVGRAEFWTSQWPTAVLALAAVLIFVARHYLHGKSITW